MQSKHLQSAVKFLLLMPSTAALFAELSANLGLYATTCLSKSERSRLMRISRGVIIQSEFVESNAANITRLSWAFLLSTDCPQKACLVPTKVSVTEQNLTCCFWALICMRICSYGGTSSHLTCSHVLCLLSLQQSHLNVSRCSLKLWPQRATCSREMLTMPQTHQKWKE